MKGRYVKSNNATPNNSPYAQRRRMWRASTVLYDAKVIYPPLIFFRCKFKHFAKGLAACHTCKFIGHEGATIQCYGAVTMHKPGRDLATPAYLKYFQDPDPIYAVQ
jgi:hypothetical protein